MTRFFDEIRDPWALGMAQVAAFAVWWFGAPVWQVPLVFVAVLLSRLVAGYVLPIPAILPPRILTPLEQHIATLVGEDVPLEDIPMKTRLLKEDVDGAFESILRKLEYRNLAEVRKWAIWVGLVPKPSPTRPSQLKSWLDSTVVRATLTAGSVIGLSWTLFQIWRYACTAFALLERCPQ